MIAVKEINRQRISMRMNEAGKCNLGKKKIDWLYGWVTVAL